MDAKKTLHIVPHSHWDREWYMPFEGHRFYLVRLMDTLIDLMERNPEYTYYHLDGQFIVIEDYLEIRPERRERLLALIRAGRIQIGPWYILQDEYLTSGEANIRNMLYGIRLCRRFGAEPVMTGYYPDAFGNISQSPQILRGFGIDNAVFGRGLNDVGSDNTLVKQNGITKSELLWQSPDGSEVIGVMFANWYNNASELPRDPEALKKRIAALRSSCERFAATPELLGMNGCDHQPVQTDLTEVIRLANEVQDEVEVRQSSIREYLAQIRKYRGELRPYRGEIAGQLTSGNCLLINTASCRVDIKQTNQKAQNLLERITEPLNAYTFLYGDTYDRDAYLYAWRILMQNHPHDSICSCSHDDIYEEMRVRFKKSMQAAQMQRQKSADFLAAHTDTSEGAERNLLIFAGEPAGGMITAETVVDYPENDPVSEIRITDCSGNEIPADIRHLGPTFTYTLPDDRFRQPATVNRFSVKLRLPADGTVGTRLLRVERGAPQFRNTVQWNAETKTLENGLLRLTFADDLSFCITDLRTGRTFGPCNWFEDTKDAGNTYNYMPVPGDTPCLTRNNPAVRAELLPVVTGADSVTVAGVIRGLADVTIRTEVTLTGGCDRAEIRTRIDNAGDNHRIRAMFANDVKTDTVLAAGQFDLVRRNITPWEHWTCPYNTQRSEQFVLLEDAHGGFLTAHRGLNEYEILRDGANTLALTLLRCVGEIGDWGDFPTPLAQCHGTYTAEYAVVPFSPETRADAVGSAYSYASDAVTAVSTGAHPGTVPAEDFVVRCTDPMIRLSACKGAEDSDDLILRLYNTDETPHTVTLTFGSRISAVSASEMDEREGAPLPFEDPARKVLTAVIGEKKIVTYRLARV